MSKKIIKLPTELPPSVNPSEIEQPKNPDEPMIFPEEDPHNFPSENPYKLPPTEIPPSEETL